MKLEEIEELAKLLEAASAQRIDPDIWRSLDVPGFTSADREYLVALALAAPALLETTRAYHRLTSAMAYLEHRDDCDSQFPVGCRPEDILHWATRLGWKEP